MLFLRNVTCISVKKTHSSFMKLNLHKNYKFPFRSMVSMTFVGTNASISQEAN